MKKTTEKTVKDHETHNISEVDKSLFVSFCTKIVATGFVPAEDLRKEYGPEDYTRCIAMIFRTHRMLREVRRKWTNNEDVLGYEWADRRFSQAEMKKLPPELLAVVELFKKSSVKYTDYANIRVRCRWTNKVFGAMPLKEESGDELNRFDRDMGDGVLIPGYCLRAMASKAMPMVGKEQSVARRIGWSAVRIQSPNIKIDTRPIIDQDGYTGLGLKRSEYLPIGTEFVIEAMIPTSIMRPDEYLHFLKVAGQFVHLSPARSSGFGDFEVVGVELS